ncbi:MAG: SDR family NAD(P)-dependent oxidoreductase, partial [Pelolinea sp.]|nr:SDR family NAD(P)-dependent oxidoreductase [Pelolinea sp.]
MQNPWNGKNAIITGASSGLGASFTKFLAQAGMHVVLIARRKDRLEKLQADINLKGGKASIFQVDLSIEKEREMLFVQILAEIGPIDILINNARFGWYGFFYDMKWELAKQMAEVNMQAVMHMTNLFLPAMVARKSGHIINIGSIAGALPSQGIAMYSASKAFIDAFTTSLHRELRGSGVHVSVMRLGPVKTDFYDQARELENGRSVPAEKHAISTGRVNSALRDLINHPRRVVYVPGWLAIIKYVENFFGWAVDLLGPLL